MWPVLGRLRASVLSRVQRTALLAVAAEQHRGAPPDLTGTVEVETTFAALLLDERDEWITPTLQVTQGWEPGQYGPPRRADRACHDGCRCRRPRRLLHLPGSAARGTAWVILAFEPAPRNYELLTANVWRNGFTNVVCFPWALGDTPGFAPLQLSASNTGDHRLHGSSGDAVTVRVAALDEVLAIRGPVDVVKLDVQGSEHAAVRGMEQLLRASPSVLVVAELSPADARAAGTEPR